MTSKTILLALLLIPVMRLNAQVSLNRSNVPKPGTIFYMYDANTPSPAFNFNKSGTGNTWDFTGVYAFPGADDTIFWTFPNQSPGGSAFPTAEVASHEGTDKTVSFINSDQNGAYLLGIGGDVLGNGNTMAVSFDAPAKAFEFPYKLNSLVNKPVTMNIVVPGSAIGQSSIDSVWFKKTEAGSKQVIAEGTLKVPAGSFSSLLEIVRKYSIDSTFIKSASTGGKWSLAPGFPKINQDSTYYWYSDKSLQHYAHVIYKGGQVTDVHYFKSVSLPSGINEINNAASDYTIYPNPTSGILTISNDYYSIEKNELFVYNTIGEQIYKDIMNTGNSKVIDLSAFPKGIYFLRMHSETRKVVIE
ncbi:MAG: T9SS type A sorting domain-containing protein [Bacteroidota bacterium]|nr:T9SS type A sorting domain-containing protein [Bacteroidota bacterium]